VCARHNRGRVVFQDENPVEKTIRIGTAVLGGRRARIQRQNVIGIDQDDVCFAPYTTAAAQIAHHVDPVRHRRAVSQQASWRPSSPSRAAA